MTNADTPSPRRTRFRRAAYAAAALGALAALYPAAWFGTAAVLEGETRAWLAQQQADGLTIATGAWHTSGFPGQIVVTIPDVSAAAPATGGGWTWRTAQIRLLSWPLQFQHLWLGLSGTHSVAGLTAAPGVPVAVSATEATGEIVLNLSGHLTRGVLTARDVAVSLAQGSEPILRIGSGRAEATLLSPGTGPETSPTLPATARLSLEARDIAPPKFFPALQEPISHALLTAEITGTWASGPLPQVLEGWRSGGGTVEIRDALLDWPPIRVAASGSFALDQRLQPTGSAAMRIQGGEALMDGLVRTGVMDESEVGIAKIVLALMSRSNAAGVQELKVPLTVQDRAVSAGPLALGTLQEVVWPPLAVP